MDDLIAISEMAKFYGITRQTLIYYDEIDLFKPVKVEGAKPLYYLKKFTKYNLKFLLILIVLHFVIPSLF